MKVGWFPLLLLLSLACRPAAQPTGVSNFPEPPQQRAVWTTPANAISVEVISATAALFDAGLADPRGCEYREIEIHIGEIWRGDGGTMKTHGWILPSASKINQNFAICWNGLVYPVISVGAQANLQSDMASLISTATTNGSSMRMALYGRAFREKMSVTAAW